jgi:glycosyltransferase involved in cell wall biosynthesis
MHFRRSSANENKIRVLFLQSGTEGESIENIHSMLVRQFDRDHIEIHIACDMSINGEKSSTYKMFEAIPDLHIRPTNFGRPIPLVSLSQNKSKLATARNLLLTGLALTGSMAGLMRYIKQHRIDIVHAGRYRDAICGALLARLTGVKCIAHIHQPPGTWEPSVYHWALRQADGIIAVSQFTAQFAVAVAGCRPERIYVAHNGVDSNRWNPDTDGSSIRREFGIAPDVWVFAIISRLDPSKGHELLLDALHRLKNELPDFKLLIVGKDRYYFELFRHSYLEVLNQRVEALGLSRQVIFTDQRPDVQAILAACDLYTMPSSEEPCAVVFAEAMAMKKAVIALDDGGTREVVEDGKSGLLSPPQDIEQLAKNIFTLVNNPVRCTQMGEYGRKRVEDYFNSRRLTDDVERVYRSVLGEAMEPKVVAQLRRMTQSGRGH